MARTGLVAGGSGLVGGELLRELLGGPSWGRVTALVRRKLPLEDGKLEQLEVDFDRLPASLAADDVFCCLGTTIKTAGSQEAFARVDKEYPLAMARSARAGGARQFLIVTAHGAGASSRIFYNRVKGQVEDALRELGFPSLHIFRPSMLLGERAERRAGERFGIAAMTAVGPLLPRSVRPIQARTVARAMIAAALRDETGVHIHESDRIAEDGA